MKTKTVLLSLVWLLLLMASPGQTAAPGYAVSNFATGFGATFAGPAGIAPDASGNLYVDDFITGFLYKFGPGGGVASAATQVNATPFFPGSRPHGLAFGKDGNLYVSLYDLGEVGQLDPVTGAVVRTIASGIFHPRALATDPLSGDLFVSQEGNTIFRVSNFSNGPGTLTAYATTPFTDGLAFGPDGTLYGADQILEPLTEAGDGQSS